MKPVLIFHVNAGEDPYEDLHRQDRMIDLLVEKDVEFELGGEIENGNINMAFIVADPNILVIHEVLELLIEAKRTRVVVVDRMLNVWLVRENREDRVGTLIEIPETGIHEVPWVLYRHETGTYHTVSDEE